MAKKDQESSGRSGRTGQEMARRDDVIDRNDAPGDVRVARSPIEEYLARSQNTRTFVNATQEFLQKTLGLPIDIVHCQEDFALSAKDPVLIGIMIGKEPPSESDPYKRMRWSFVDVTTPRRVVNVFTSHAIEQSLSRVAPGSLIVLVHRGTETIVSRHDSEVEYKRVAVFHCDVKDDPNDPNLAEFHAAQQLAARMIAEKA